MNRQLAFVLEKAGVLTPDSMRISLRLAEESHTPLPDVLVNAGHLSEERLAETLAGYLRLPYLKLAATTIEPEALEFLTEKQARKYTCLPLKREADQNGSQPGRRRPVLMLAMADPTDLDAIQQIEFSTGCAVKPAVATRTEIKDAILRHYATDTWLRDFLKSIKESSDFSIAAPEEEQQDVDPERAGKKTPAVKLVNVVIQNAIAEAASDIHIEPSLNHVVVRNRVQGLLREFMKVPKAFHEPLVSRLKILAKLNITERRVPQDGRIRVVYQGRDVDLRVSTLPTHFGEKVVLRVLGAGQSVPALSALGLAEADIAALKQAADAPQGLMLATGPTGSGKTTTLYSLLEYKKRPDINIITVEDPIEFQLAGINQVQVNTKAGLTFAASLRSILRQDPDVILIGEIRDLETAEIAFHASMTGHLVLSTLHTNSTAATVGRLLDIGIHPQLIASISVIIAQRLIRKLCEKCKERHSPEPVELSRLNMAGEGRVYYRARGCEACGHTGYAGRIGIYEIMKITPVLRELIGKRAPEADLRKAACAAGCILLLDGAVEQIKRGVTSVEEVLRVMPPGDSENTTECPNCKASISSSFSSCPYCLYALKVICDSCTQELKREWRICPYCSALVAPPLPKAAAEPVTAAPGPAPVSQRPRIMVVDDDEMMRWIVVRSVQVMESRPEVMEASSGEQALEMAARSNPDLIVLDVKMPGLSGFEVCQRLRSNVQTAFVPVLMLTASTDEESRTQGYLVGTDDFIAKPLSVPELHSRIKRLLRRTYGM